MAQHDFDPGIAVRCHLPSPALAGYVTFYYFVETDEGFTDFLYPEWGNVRFALSGEWFVEMPGYPLFTPQDAVLYGPTDRHGAVSTPGGKCFGFGLTPIGWHRLIGGDASKMANQVVHLGDALGVDGDQLRAAIIADASEVDIVARIEQVIQARLNTRPAVEPQVISADRALRNRPATMREFAALAGMSERTLYRLCMRTFGFPPKRLMRLQRFLDTLGLVRIAIGQAVSESISDGYFDQAHFYRDFREFMAMTPREYFGAPRVMMATAAEAQMRAGITLSFRLPDPPG